MRDSRIQPWPGSMAPRLGAGPPPGATELLTIEQDHVGRRTVISAVGEIDVSTVARMQAALDTARGTSSEVWLDLTGTTFMDSSGIHVVLAAHAALAEANGRFVVICSNGPVLRVLELTQADHTLEIHASRTAAHYAT